MDRSDSGLEPSVSLAPDASAGTRDDVVVSVCTTCRAADTTVPPTAGPALLDALKQIFDERDAPARVRAVQCLGVCKRPVTVAVTSPDGYTFMFGDLDVERGVSALVEFVKSYRISNYGLVPWRARAEVLRKGMVARIPPAVWSPENGEPPK
jgi:predicted metal-binding protein